MRIIYNFVIFASTFIQIMSLRESLRTSPLRGFTLTLSWPIRESRDEHDLVEIRQKLLLVKCMYIQGFRANTSPLERDLCP